MIVKDLTFEEANVLEQFFIQNYQTNRKEFGYNMTRGGQNAPTMTGKHHSKETRKKMHDVALGRVISEEQKRKHSAVMKGRMVGSKNHKSRAVRCIETGEVFETQRAAAEAKGVLQSKISLCCQGKSRQTHGLRWEYVERMET